MISVVCTDVQLEALGPEWAELWDRTPAATPFQSPRWLLPWWHHFGTGVPRVAINRREGRLTGVLPLYILPDERKALPIGVGTTDYLDALGDQTGLLDAALAAISADHVTSCELIDIHPGSALLGASSPGWSADWHEGSPCPVLTLPNITKLARRKLNLNRNRAGRIGGWEIVPAGAGTIRQHVDTLICLHQARWTAQNEPGVMADPRVVAFWHEAAPGLLDAGLLRLNTLLLRGKVAAIMAALLAPGRIFFYLSGFDDAHAYFSPGTLLLGAMLEQAVAEGRHEAHFLRGRESYKYVWGAMDRLNWCGRFSSKGLSHRQT